MGWGQRRISAGATGYGHLCDEGADDAELLGDREGADRRDVQEHGRDTQAAAAREEGVVGSFADVASRVLGDPGLARAGVQQCRTQSLEVQGALEIPLGERRDLGAEATLGVGLV